MNILFRMTLKHNVRRIVMMAAIGMNRDGKSKAIGRPPFPNNGGGGAAVTADKRRVDSDRCMLEWIAFSRSN